MEEKLRRFGRDENIEIVFEQVAVTEQQIEKWKLPTRNPKRKSPADRNWKHNYACELDAIAPDELRNLVELVISYHLPQRQFEVAKIAEESERELLKAFAQDAVAKGFK